MTPETVTPTKFRAADGTVYERTGEKRTPEVGELHWCDATQPAPYPFEWPPATHWEPREDWPPALFQCEDPEGTMQVGEPPAARTVSNYHPPEFRPCKNCGKPAAAHRGYASTNPHEPLICPQFHKCPVWQFAEDQSWQPPTPVASQDNPIDSLIDKLKTTAGDLESIPVLAMLYQAKALERIADGISEQNAHLWRIADALRANAGPRPATNADLLRVGAYVCGFCAAGEHSDCANPTECICVECRNAPPKAAPSATVCAMCRLDEHERCLNPRPNSISQADGQHIVGQCQCVTCGSPPADPTYVHAFEGMEDNHFCTQCGGGRLHPIHQIP